MNVVPVVLSYQVPCDFCHRPFKRLYPLNIDNQKFMFCSPPHYVQAKTNWEQKKEMGLDHPGISSNTEQPQEEMVGLQLAEDSEI